MFNKIRNFSKSDSGAVTVDWVVLTAGVVALAAGVATVIVGGGNDGILNTLKTKITSTISGI